MVNNVLISMNAFWITTDVMEMPLVAIRSAAIHAIAMTVLLAMVKTVACQILVRLITAMIMQNVFQRLQLNSNVNAKKDSGAMVLPAMIAMNVLNMKIIDAMHWLHVKILSVRSIVTVKMVSKVMVLSATISMNVKLVNITALQIVLSA